MRFRYVLSNRFVFKLVQQPPADMAALLHAFSSMPPIVKRRAKELLDIIRDAVKRGLSGAAEEPRETPFAAPSEATVVSSQMDVDGSSAPKPPLRPQSTSLWSRSKDLPIAATSTLFGTTILPSRAQPVYSTSRSSLFGSLPPSGVPKLNSLSQFQDVVNKIHSTLVIAPTVPAVRALCLSLLFIFLTITPGPALGDDRYPHRSRRCHFYRGHPYRRGNSRDPIRSSASQAASQG